MITVGKLCFALSVSLRHLRSVNHALNVCFRGLLFNEVTLFTSLLPRVIVLPYYHGFCKNEINNSNETEIIH